MIYAVTIVLTLAVFLGVLRYTARVYGIRPSSGDAMGGLMLAASIIGLLFLVGIFQ